MRSKVTVVLLFLNVVLFGYIYYFHRPGIAPDLEPRKRVLGPEAATIDSLERTSRSGAPVKLERRPGGSGGGESWWLTAPQEWPADRNAVASIINELQFLEHVTSFAVADLPASNQTLKDFGLDDPAITLTFTSAGKRYTLKIGDDTNTGNRLYLLSPNGTRIHVVSRSLAESVGRPVDQLRSRSIFTVQMFEVRSLNLQTAPPSNLKVRLRANAGRWSFESPIHARANKGAVEVTINQLNALTAKSFLEPAAADLERTGLNSPALHITLEGNARRETLLLGGAAAPDEYYAKIDDKPVVFTVAVPAPLLEVLRSAQEALRDTQVVDFRPDTVTTLTLAAPGQPELTLARDTGTAPAAWQSIVRVSGQAPLTAAADSAVVSEVLEKISQLSAKKFLSDAPSDQDVENYGFKRAEREITLSLNTGGGLRGTDPTTLTLQVGVSPDKPGEAYARVLPAPYVYQVLPDIINATPTLARHYRQRLLRELPETARLTRITLTELPGNRVLWNVQNEAAITPESLAAVKLPDPVRAALGTLLGQVRTLRAQRFTAETFNPDQADTPQGSRPWKYRLEVDITFAGGSGTAQNSTSTLLLTDRLDGTTLLAGTAEFGGVVFAVPQEMLDVLFALTYVAKNDPGPPAVPPAAPPLPAGPAAAAETPNAKPEEPKK